VFTPYALFPLLAAFCYSAYAIVTRMVSAEESPWTSFLWSGLFGALVSSALVPWFWTAPGGVEIVLMLVIGGVGGVGQFLLILAFRAAPASVLAPFSYLGLALAALWGLLFFGEVPDGPTIAGALIIVGAGLYVWHRERQQGTA
ncbi:MAG: EamA family transporter, partial [Rubricella sp.]